MKGDRIRTVRSLTEKFPLGDDKIKWGLTSSCTGVSRFGGESGGKGKGISACAVQALGRYGNLKSSAPL